MTVIVLSRLSEVTIPSLVGRLLRFFGGETTACPAASGAIILSLFGGLAAGGHLPVSRGFRGQARLFLFNILYAALFQDC